MTQPALSRAMRSAAGSGDKGVSRRGNVPEPVPSAPAARSSSVFSYRGLRGAPPAICLASRLHFRLTGTMGIPGSPRYNDGSVTVIRRIHRAHPAVVSGLLAILMAAVPVPISLCRLGDEDTYLLVSPLVTEAQLSDTLPPDWRR